MKKAIDLSVIAEDISQEVKLPPQATDSSDYVEVKMIGSGGRLSAPPALHFKNYSFEDSVRLARATDETIDATLVGVLNGMVREDFDCGLLHREELKEVLLAIYGAFWDRKLEVYYYAVDESKPMAPDNRSVASLPISAIDIKELDRSFKEPLVVTDSVSKKQIGFCLPRMMNTSIADRWIEDRYKEEETSYSDIRWTIAQNERRPIDQQLPYDHKMLKDYIDYMERMSDDRARVLQALQIYSVDSKVLTTLEDKLKALSEGASFFARYLQDRDRKYSFGVQPDVKFSCAVTHQEITRRFPFRCVDFIPSLDAVGDSRYSVSLG